MLEHCKAWYCSLLVPKGPCPSKTVGEANAKNVCEMDGNQEVCPLQYFTAECFKESAALASQFGISYKRSRRLVQGTVSTIFHSAATVATAEVADYESAPSSSSRKRPAAAESSSRKRTVAELLETATNKRSAVEKRERAWVWQTIIKRNKNHSYK